MLSSQVEAVQGITIIGLGPGGIGPLVAAGRLGNYDELLTLGVTAIDPCKENIGAGGLDLEIKSNSPGSDFEEAFEQNRQFENLLREPEAQYLHEHEKEEVPLTKVASFLRLAGRAIVNDIQNSPNGKIINTPVTHIQYDSQSGAFTTYSLDQTLEQSKRIVLSPGAYEPIHPELEGFKAKLRTSHEIFTDKTSELLEELFATSPNPKITIVGSSHGAFAAADRLLNLIGERQGHITILKRSDVKEFYDNPEEARKAGYEFSERDVCPLTHRVNRFGGLRGPSKLLHQNYRTGKETRLSIEPVGEELRNNAYVNNCDLVIQALGYQPRDIPIVDQNGNRIGPVRHPNGHVKVDENGRIFVNIDGNEVPLRNGFAIGLGHGMYPDGKIGGEPAFHGPVDGVNVFHGFVGEIIARNLLEP